MSDLRDLYQELIVDHYRRPHNYGPLVGANRHAEGFNPLCGDRLTLSLNVVDGMIKELRFEGVGCAISTASASLMTDALKGKTKAQAEAMFQHFQALVTGTEKAEAPVSLGKLEVLAGVREFPVRVKCATLAWHTLLAALHSVKQPVSTE
jgi:nitrogen fixation NifU-like protein